MNSIAPDPSSTPDSLLRPDLLAVIANTLPDRLFLLQVEPDTCFRFLCVNESFLLGAGLTREQVIGKRIEDIVPPPFHVLTKSNLLKAVHDNATVTWSDPAFLVPEKHPAEVAVTPLANKAGGIIQLAGVIRDLSWRRDAEEEGRELSCHLLQLQDEERRRIGRELHDSTAQELAAVGMNIGLVLQRNEGRNETNDALLSDSLAIIEQCNHEIRIIAYLLHPPLLEDMGLAAASHEYVDGFSQRSGIQITIEVSSTVGRLPPLAEQALFRVLQESLGNVHRHSGSRTAAVRFWRDKDSVVLEIKDQGHGLPPDMITREDGRISKVGVGIAGMRERIRQLGGLFTIESSPRGVTVRAMIPAKGDVA
ncbi:MAG: PAS domain-containing sensor histidine kinase [bacterium]